MMLTRRWRQRLCGITPPGHDWIYDPATAQTLCPTRECRKCGRGESETPNFSGGNDRWVLTDPYDSQPKY